MSTYYVYALYVNISNDKIIDWLLVEPITFIVVSKLNDDSRQLND